MPEIVDSADLTLEENGERHDVPRGACQGPGECDSPCLLIYCALELGAESPQCANLRGHRQRHPALQTLPPSQFLNPAVSALEGAVNSAIFSCSITESRSAAQCA